MPFPHALLRPGLLLMALSVLAFAPARAQADEPRGDSEPALPELTSRAWKPFTFGNIDKHTVYSVVEEDSGWLRAESECAASARMIRLEDVDLAKTPVLHWRWRVDRPLTIEAERTKAGDDFAARVYVMFRFEPDKASFLQRLRHRVGSAAYAVEAPGSALSLVWSSREPEGAHWKSPYGDESAMLVVAGGRQRQTGTWYRESLDIASAYRASFATDPPPLLALAVMTDADNSCGKATAGFADFHFSADS